MYRSIFPLLGLVVTWPGSLWAASASGTARAAIRQPAETKLLAVPSEEFGEPRGENARKLSIGIARNRSFNITRSAGLAVLPQFTEDPDLRWLNIAETGSHDAWEIIVNFE